MMIPRERFERESSVFQKVASVPPEARAAILDAECGGDHSFRHDVESLLAADAMPPSWFRDAQMTVEAAHRASEALADDEAALHSHPERIGEYRILGVLGTGGMGVVYRALQPALEREVAVKVVRMDILSSHAHSAFMREAAMLARLAHPNILHIYEAGVAATACAPGGPVVHQPYFAMELIENGRSITEYARVQALDTNQRIELFLTVCRAVQHAHDRSIIHRDLKPANILVTQDGQPKVLDFGIARTLAQLNETSREGAATQVIGTPPYVCPEQLTGVDAPDARFDVFSLGMVLRDLLEGATSGRSSRLAANDPGLARIIERAIARDRERRFGSATELAAALEARLRRGRGQVPRGHRITGGLAAAAAVVGISIILVNQWNPSTRAANPQAIEDAAVEPVAESAQAASSETPVSSRRDGRRGGPAAARMHELAMEGELEEYIVELRRELDEVRGAGGSHEERVRNELGAALAELGEFKEAEEHFRWGLDLETARLPAGSFEILVKQTRLGWTIAEQGRYKEAQAHFEQVLGAAALADGADTAANPGRVSGIVAQAQVGLALCLVHAMKPAEAEHLLNQGLATLREQFGPQHSLVARAQQIAIDLERMGDVRE